MDAEIHDPSLEGEYLVSGDAPTVATAPQIFYMNDSDIILNWVAEGSDGRLYTVPAQAGGWMLRENYEGPRETLRPVSWSKATTIMWFVYGDTGNMTINCR